MVDIWGVRVLSFFLEVECVWMYVEFSYTFSITYLSSHMYRVKRKRKKRRRSHKHTLTLIPDPEPPPLIIMLNKIQHDSSRLEHPKVTPRVVYQSRDPPVWIRSSEELWIFLLGAGEVDGGRGVWDA